MNWKKLLLIAAVAGAFTFAAAAKSEAGVRVGIGIGFPVGYGYSYGYPYAGYYPYGYGYPYYAPMDTYRMAMRPVGLWPFGRLLRDRWWSTATGTTLSTTALVRRREPAPLGQFGDRQLRGIPRAAEFSSGDASCGALWLRSGGCARA